MASLCLSMLQESRQGLSVHLEGESVKAKRRKQDYWLAVIEELFGQRIVAAYLLTGTLGSLR